MTRDSVSKGCDHRPWVRIVLIGGEKRGGCQECVDKLKAACERAGVPVQDSGVN